MSIYVRLNKIVFVLLLHDNQMRELLRKVNNFPEKKRSHANKKYTTTYKPY